MKNLNTKTLLAASIATLINVNAFAVDDVSSVLTVTFDHPQSVAIGDATNVSTATVSADTGGSAAVTQWEVTSNNAVTLAFTGTSFDNSGNEILTPILAKQEVDATDHLVTNQYDQLTTEYGVTLLNTGSTQNGLTEWASGASTAGELTENGKGTPANLVSSSSANGPTQTFGAIMPTDEGTFTYSLYTKGTGDLSTTQSGNYTATITTTVTANELLGAAGAY